MADAYGLSPTKYPRAGMATHYETLGITPTSTTQEIRKAYLRRARALHPDRQQGKTEKEARRAEQAMQQVNVAWNVLSDPAKKADYDSGLRPRTTPTAQRASTAQRQASRPTAGSAGHTTQQPYAGRAIDEEGGDGSVSVWASVPVLLVLGLLLGVLIVTAFADGEPADNRPVIQSSTELDVGDCFTLVANTPRERSCSSGSADGQVIEIGPEAGNCPENTQSLKDPSSDFFLCWARMMPGSTNTVAG